MPGRSISPSGQNVATTSSVRPSSIVRAASLSLDDADQARKFAGKWRDAGWSYLVCGWPGEGDAAVERFAREVMPDFAD